MQEPAVIFKYGRQNGDIHALEISDIDEGVSVYAIAEIIFDSSLVQPCFPVDFELIAAAHDPLGPHIIRSAVDYLSIHSLLCDDSSCNSC